jgi:tetratricopeptide (TPR) repeat protein
MRNELILFAAKPVRALRAGRFPLAPVVAGLSRRLGLIMQSYKLEEDGRFEEALATWSKLKTMRQTRASAFRHTLRCAKLAHRAGRYGDAVKDFGVLMALNPGDPRVVRGLESAALRAARHAQSAGQWLEACRMWSTFARVSDKMQKSIRNLRDCARYVAQSADGPEKMADALEAWGLLKSLDPDSREAKQGQEWCRLSLARTAERMGDAVAARRHWNALLELAPGDQRALDGLHRLDAAAA